jgi:hypothetical protein
MFVIWFPLQWRQPLFTHWRNCIVFITDKRTFDSSCALQTVYIDLKLLESCCSSCYGEHLKRSEKTYFPRTCATAGVRYMTYDLNLSMRDIARRVRSSNTPLDTSRDDWCHRCLDHVMWELWRLIKISNADGWYSTALTRPSGSDMNNPLIHSISREVPRVATSFRYIL